MSPARFEIYSKINKYIIDGSVIAVAFYLAYLIRFEGTIPPSNAFQFWALFPLVVAGRLTINTFWGVYDRMWRYVSTVDATHIVPPYIIFSGLLVVLRLGSPDQWALFRIPLSVIAIEFLVSLPTAVGVRFLRRLFYHRQLYSGQTSESVRRVLLVGAGSAGVLTAKELLLRKDIKVVGFLDDDPLKIGSMISGVRILGPIQSLARVVKEYGVREVVVCMSRPSRDVLRRIWQLCEGLNIQTLMVPDLHEMVDGEVRVSRLRQFTMEELLSRATVDHLFDTPGIAALYKSKRILITGAGGSIGSELARQLARLDPDRLLLMDKDEDGLYNLQQYFSAQPAAPRYELLVGDIRSVERVRNIFEKFRPEIVFHAAAHKHVPLMELNPTEAVANNVFGTKVLADQTVAFGGSLFVLISSDKAVNPSSVMGVSKRLAELVVQTHCDQSKTNFFSVRFGNVMNSRGSVIPLFQSQILAGKPITLTHPNVIRYFMTIPEAVQLVAQVGFLGGSNGSIYVLDMGDPVRILDLARDLVELHGLRLGHDIRIENVGLRPGEKLREELFGNGERLMPTDNPRIFSVRAEKKIETHTIDQLLEALGQAVQCDDGERLGRLFEEFGLGYRASQPELKTKPL